jgi:site-specific DNA-methyltransferase (adenine-specific)
LTNRRFLGIDMEKEFLEISKSRKLEIENPTIAETYKQKINGFNATNELKLFLESEFLESYSNELPF